MCIAGPGGGPLELETASNVLTRLEVRGLELSLFISSAVSPIGPSPPTPPGVFLLAELWPLSWDMTGLLRLLSLLLCSTSFPTPPEEDVAANRADCSGLPLMS
jgi:hypothetical protein